MFKKAPFNPSFFLELKKEFAVYGQRAFNLLEAFLKMYPKQAYIGMITCMIISAILAFTVMRDVRNPLVGIKIDDIHSSAETLKEVLELQSKINELLQKDNLNAADSLAIKQALNKLEIINHQMKR